MMQDVKFTERYRAQVVRQHLAFYRKQFRDPRRARRCMERFTKLSCSDLAFKVMLNEVFRNG